MSTIARTLPPTEAAILERLVTPEFTAPSPELARRILAMRFGAADVDRINALSAKAQEGTLTPQEDEELEIYLRVGHMLSIMKSKARQSLKGTDSSR